MESISYNDEESSDQEVVDQESNNLGVGRSYECVFCKRGFNTAQALGGHMNIHRKDRARNKPADHHHDSDNLRQQQIHYTPPSFTLPSSNYCNNFDYQTLNHRLSSSQHHQPSLSYATFFPPSDSRPLIYGDGHQINESDLDHQPPSNPGLIPGDWRIGLSLEFRPVIMEDMETSRVEEMNREEDLDLELRLGYD